MTRRKRLDFVSRACIGMFLLLFGEIVADAIKDQALPGKNLDFDQSRLPSNETFPPKNVPESNATNLVTSPSFGASAQNSSFSSRPSEAEEQDSAKSDQDVEKESQTKSHVPSDGTGSDRENVPTSATSLNMQDERSAGRSDRNSTTDKLPSDPTSDPMADRVRLVDNLMENVDRNASTKATPKEPVRSSTISNLDTSTPSTLTARLESNRDGSVNLPEVRLVDREDDERDREATTQPGDHRELLDEENGSPKESTDETRGSESFNLENTGKTKNDGVSLANDTRVNYGRKDEAGQKEDGSEDPKGEVEVIKDVSHPPLRKLIAKDETYTSDETRGQTNGTLENELDDKVGAEVGAKGKFAYGLSANASEDSGKDSSGSAKSEEVPRKMAHTASSKAEDDVNDERGTVLTTTSNPSLVPRGRTIAFSGANEFSSTEEKISVSGSSREAGNGHDSRDKGSEVSTKKNASGEKIDQKPYPYVKSTKMTPQEHVVESFDATRTEHGKVPESTSEESSAYENTISRRQESETKFVVTEPSVVIENSIQQFKTTYDKRAGSNTTGGEFTVKSQPPVAVTLTSLETSDKDAGINSTLGDEKKATVLLADSSRTTVADGAPHRTDVIDERKEITGKDENFDVTGNGITEISPKSDESSYGSSFHADVAPNSTTVTSDSSNVTRTTEKTEMSTNVDVQTDAEESLLLLSTLNATETSTEYPLMKSNLTEDAGLTATTNEPSTSPATVVLSNDTESETLATTSPTFTTTPMTSLTSDQVSNDTARITESAWNLNGTSAPMTTTTIEYEFVGLTDVTEPNNETLTTDRGTTHLEDYTENFTTPIPTTVSLNDTTDEYPISERTLVSISFGVNNSIFSTGGTDTVKNVLTTLEMPLGSTTRTSSTTPSVHTVVVDPTGSNFSTTVKVPSASSTEGTVPIDTNPTTNNSHESSSHSPVPSSTLHPRVVPSISIASDDPALVTTEKAMEKTSETPRILPPDDIPLLVRIVIVGSLSEVCPHVPKLRQVLAEMLNSELSSPTSEKQVIFHQNPCTESQNPAPTTTDVSFTSVLVYIVDEDGKFDTAKTKMLPSLNQVSGTDVPLTISSIRLVQDTPDSGNAIAVVIVCSVAFICLVLLAGLLFIMRKRQTRFNYGERCRPVSLDAYSLDSVSAYNSVRRKGVARSSKRSYGNPTFEDSSAIPSHPLNFAGLSSFHTDVNAINEEFSGIPQVWAKIDELPAGAEVKNRYANVIPLPETRVPLQRVNNDPLSEYINASYVRGPKNATKYYIACQAPMETTVTDFWRMIWEQQSKVIIMLTDLVENGIDKCTEYIPPSEVTDCHRLYGDFQVTLKKRETKEKYAISTLHLKNLENNTFREVYHIWYLWPVNGVQSDGTGLIAILLEARALQRGGPGPIVVHCSPGTGRTGTLIALDLGIRQYEITRTVDVPRVVYTIRRDRAGAVQTKEQYGFIYKALNLYATKLAGGVLESS